MRATYRLQLHKDFTLDDARRILPYLERLGVSHLYASPILEARPGSTHGYDVANPLRTNPELGGDQSRRSLVAALHEREMGMLLDIVPNHMGTGSANPFWEDILTHGAASRWAHWFDVAWRGGPEPLEGRILLPVLGDRLNHILEQGELALKYEKGEFRVHYHENSFPLDPQTIPRIMEAALPAFRKRRGGADADLDELDAILSELRALPPRTRTDETTRGQRGQRATAALQRLAALADHSKPVRDFLTRTTASFHHGADGPARLRAFLDRQAYRLAFWRRAARVINYRRFFDINELVALRMEDPRVFEETHACILEWVADGALDGLRIDHIDGLMDPKGYLRRLRDAVNERMNTAGTRIRSEATQAHRSESGVQSHAARPARLRGGPAQYASGSASTSVMDSDPQVFPILVEKILSPGEDLRRDWPVQGTTGYEFLNDLEAIFIDPEGRDRLVALYRRITKAGEFEELAYRGKARILESALRADVRRLANDLAAIARSGRAAGKLAVPQLARTIVELIAALPVYRTYVDPWTGESSRDDAEVMARAVERAGEMGRRATPRALELIRDVVLNARGERERLRFVARFQQTSGPATAKGVEDTALYQWVPLASLNEVGGEPDRSLADAPGVLHEANAKRAASWPGNLLCVNTHDTKRSADVRARIDVLSEIPDEWEHAVTRWRETLAPHRTAVRGRKMPDPATEWLILQTLVGMWPVGVADVPSGKALTEIRERLERYLEKAAREAKVHTSWTDPNEEFESAVKSYIGGMFSGGARSRFLKDVAEFAGSIERAGMWNALARCVLHLTSPGVPDIYQGDELWNFSLVDPDNRRPVDYEERSRALDDLARLGDGAIPAKSLRGLIDGASDGRVKLLVMWRTLQERKRRPELWARGDYEPVHAIGAHAPHVFSFARALDDDAAIAVVPRLTVALGGRGEPPVAAVWGDTSLALPRDLADREWRCVLTGRFHTSRDGALPLDELLGELPVCLLVS